MFCEIFCMKERGKTHREIGDIYGLTIEQIKGFVNHGEIEKEPHEKISILGDA